MSARCASAPTVPSCEPHDFAVMSLLVAEAKLWLQIAPAYLGDVDLGIREQLNASLLRHVSALNGAVLAYDSLKLLDGLGCIRNDLPHIHLPVSLRILVFAPRVGDVLSGVVGRQGIDHTVLLVHGMFSATVVSTKKRAEGKLMRFVVRECNVADGRLSLVGDYSSSASRAGGAEHVLAGPSGASSPLRVSASRAVDVPEAVSFLRRFLDEDGKSVHADVLVHMQRVCDAIEANAAARGGGGGAEGAPQEGEPPEEKKKKKKKKDKDGTPTPTPSTPATLATPAAATPAASATPAANGHANGTGGSKEAPSAVSGKKAKRDRPVATPADAAAGAATAAAATAAGSGKKAKREKKKKDQDGAESGQKESA